MISDCDVPFTPQRQRSQLAVSSKKSVFSPQSNSVSSDRLNFTIFDFEILFFLSFFLSKFIYFLFLFLAALGLCCCARAFSGCGQRRLLFVVVHGLLIEVASLVAEHGL